MIDVNFDEIIHIAIIDNKLHCFVRDHTKMLLCRALIFENNKTINEFISWYVGQISKNQDPEERVAAFEIMGDDKIVNFDKMKKLMKLRGATPEQLQKGGFDD